jgi:Mg-chelatase subunit ChlD
VTTARDTALYLIYQSVRDRVAMSLVEFTKAMGEWEVEPFEHNGAIIGGVLARGNEIHLGLAERPKGTIRKGLRQAMAERMARYGSLTTQVMQDNVRGLQFCERLGFKEVGRQGDKILLMCDRSKYVQ